MVSRKSHKTDITLTEAKTTDEAMNYLFIGLKYFLVHHTKKTIIVLFAVTLGLAYAANDYFASDKVKIKELAPIGENFSIVPELVAGGKNQIVIGGKVYGLYDEDVEVWKVEHEDALILHNHVTGKIWKMEMPAFTKSK